MSEQDTTQPVEAAPAEAAPQVDLAPLMDRVEQIGGTLDQLVGAYQTEPQAEPEDPWAWLSAQQEPEPEPQQQPQLDPAQFSQAVQAQIQQALHPTLSQLQELQSQVRMNQLYERIPQLKTDQDLARSIGERALQQLSHYPPEVAQQFANDPAFIELVFKAAEAEKLAANQRPADGDPSILETAGGANPGGNGEEPSIVQQAFAARTNLPKGFL